MNIHLPNLKKTSGFTLIEMLVVIAIIAIISVIAITLYSNVQADARDGKRKAEMEAIANALEVNKDTATGKYVPLVAATMFGGGAFPGGGSTALDPSTYPYCIAASTTSTIPSQATDAGPSYGFTTVPACPATGTTYNLINGSNPLNTTVSWRLCTRLEKRGTGELFCRTNVQ
ncbi:MAG: prepilin-type N-terminal cleavage/methylation domain-containing protein [bacterium]|nr:prepilin-type N-terminal cleavage/methylation domain-containing protein [bacterium]